MTVAEVAIQAGLSLAGFVVGYLAGRLERMTATGKTPRQRWRDLARVAGALIVIVVVVVSYWLDRQRTECQRQWFEEASQAIVSGRAAIGQANRDLREFADESLNALEGPGQASEPIREALVKLRDSLDMAEAVRRDEPIPSPPEC